MKISIQLAIQAIVVLTNGFLTIVHADDTIGYLGDEGEPLSAFPLPKCKGDCDFNVDCRPGLACFERDNGDLDVIPGCVGSLSNKGDNDFCFDPDDIDEGILFRVVNDRQPASLYPLQACLGDCDTDADCEGNLKCFQRNNGDITPIPGCQGIPSKDNDYCFDPDQDDSNDDNDDDDDGGIFNFFEIFIRFLELILALLGFPIGDSPATTEGARV